jgi:hypothetical protein
MRIRVLRKQRRVFMSHYGAGKQKQDRECDGWFEGRGKSLRSAERVVILYSERTLLIACRYPTINILILRQKKVPTLVQLLNHCSGYNHISACEPGRGPGYLDRHDENLKEVGEIGKRTRPQLMSERSNFLFIYFRPSWYIFRSNVRASGLPKTRFTNDTPSLGG